MEVKQILDNAKKACRKIIDIEQGQVNRILQELANEAEHSSAFLIAENRKDLDRMDPENPKYDRIRLNPERIKGIADDLRNVSQLRSPLEQTIEERTLENGLHLKKVRVALGVVGIIYEARPNVTFDVFSLCLKSGNVCLLKGGRDAVSSNLAIMSLIHKVLERQDVPRDIVQLLPATHEATSELLHAVDHVDIIIPRGSQQLIDFVRENARVPVIETGAGIVHTYYDKSAAKDKGKAIVENAKLRRVSVCNALDCLVIHSAKLDELPGLVDELGRKETLIYADDSAYEILKNTYPASFLVRAEESHYGTEFLSKKMAVKTVESMDEALDHIARYSSGHSEAVIAEDEAVIGRFFREVDAAAVYANTSTAFTDGAQFGMGAEIGISTQKLHARGPMALQELTSYKWIIRGQGQIRQP